MANLNQILTFRGSHQNFPKIFTCNPTEIKTYASWLDLIEKECLGSHTRTVHLQRKCYTHENHARRLGAG